MFKSAAAVLLLEGLRTEYTSYRAALVSDAFVNRPFISSVFTESLNYTESGRINWCHAIIFLLDIVVACPVAVTILSRRTNAYMLYLSIQPRIAGGYVDGFRRCS